MTIATMLGCFVKREGFTLKKEKYILTVYSYKSFQTGDKKFKFPAKKKFAAKLINHDESRINGPIPK